MTTAASSDDPVLKQVYRDFISGCHILHNRNVLDAYGHLSVRHPHHPDRFIMSRYIAPATISSEQDLIEYWVDTAEPVDVTSTKGYSERCIHSEILKRFPEVNSAIHSHSQAVVPYTISGVPLRPCFHMAGFLGQETPVFDIAKAYRPEDKKNMLISNTHLGDALALCFAIPGQAEPCAAVLMRGHGFTVQGSSILDAVLRAVYTQQNASIQTTALTTRAAHLASSGVADSQAEIAYLSSEECIGATEMTRWSVQRPWRLWLREVEASGLYVNMA